MSKTILAVNCRDRASRDCTIVLSRTPNTVWLRVADVERLLDLTQAEARYTAIGIQIAGLQSTCREAGAR